IMIANALGANVVAVDIAADKLDLARAVGASVTINAAEADVVQAVREATGGGAHVSLDALGSPTTCFNSIANLRKRGKHIQVGLMLADHSHPAIPMDKVIANELEILGSHGMQAHRYDAVLAMITNGLLQPEKLVGRTITLEKSTEALPRMNEFATTGVTVIDRF
ncbi:MAG: zinc-binding dehydrogenase, partial [Anaerolineales bacterium]|nr:zinc-binding dehydrogenase [Anaerolineales bacterium]